MKRNGFFALFFSGFIVFLFSCTKLNEPTELGDNLLPAIDNINTFDTTLNVTAGYQFLNDSTKHLLGENMALGKLNDPLFGTTTADMYFNVSSPVYGSSPFVSKDSVIGIDSVVLSLAYRGAYGDTTAGTQLSVSVSEINTGNAFNDTTLYRYDQAGFTTGTSLATKTFSVSSFKDSITLIRKTDTFKVAKVLRIRLNNSLGTKLSQFDTAAGKGAYASDSLFRTIFRGLAVKTTALSGPGALGYFNLSDTASGLVVYYRTHKSGVIDTASVKFKHLVYSQANSVIRTPSGPYLANAGKPSQQQLYLQSSPAGSYVSVYIPKLSTFPNKIINRAELIAYTVPSTLDNIFTPPSSLFLDHKGQTDTLAYLFDNDIQPSFDGSLNLSLFGGKLRSDNSYRFNISRYVQGIVTLHNKNDTLRLYAPLRTLVYSKSLGQKISIPVLSNIAAGRVVLAGPDYPNPNLQLRLRIIYTNL